jgi:Zn-dependent peptidase ImmA (M78 family)
MISGVVGSNNRRKLDPNEFRGFALPDKMAPLVFINAADTKAAQMFTLAHELAHIWLGQSALSDPLPVPARKVEVWRNRVAAELLVPLAALKTELGNEDPHQAVARLAKAFQVSTPVILRRLLDARAIPRTSFERMYDAQVRRFAARARSSGGDFYLTQAARLSRRSARAIITSTLEGQTLFRDAFYLLGIRTERTFRELGRELQVLP